MREVELLVDLAAADAAPRAREHVALARARERGAHGAVDVDADLGALRRAA